MEKIIEEELYGAIGTFFVAFIFSAFYLSDFIGKSILSFLFIPLLLTIAIFLY